MPGHSNYKKYRLLPLIGVGTLILVALVLISLLIWTVAAYGGQKDPAQSGATAAVIYLGAVFISCLAMTLLIRGGTVIPSAILGVLAAVISILLAPEPAPFGKILLKVVITLAVAAAGFAVGKLISGPQLPGPAPRRPSDRKSDRKEDLSSWDVSTSINEPGK